MSIACDHAAAQCDRAPVTTASHLLDRRAALRTAWTHVVGARHEIARQIDDIEDVLAWDIRLRGPILHRNRIYTSPGGQNRLYEAEVRASVAVTMPDDAAVEVEGE